MAKSKKDSVNRRNFLKGAAAGAAASAVALAGKTEAQQAPPLPAAVPPTDAQLAAEAGVRAQSTRVIEHPASDYMVDVIRALGIEYVAANPGSSFDGIHESIINYGNNKNPEFLTCCHEESAVAMCHGYSKIEGKPMMALLHGTVGLQHGSMAIYNAYADRVPIFMVAGLDYQGSVAAHNAIDMASMVRDFVKWDDQPRNLNGFAQSALRAYRLATTAPMGPVLLVAEATIQRAPLPQSAPAVPRITMPLHPSADLGSVREVARMLVAAENPRINAGRVARTQKGLDLLVELADLVQAPVNSGADRVNFPSRHPLSGNGTGGTVDFVLNLEGGAGVRNVKTVSISSAEFLATQNYNINAAGGPLADLSIVADAEATLPAIIEEVKRLITADRRRVFQERGMKHAEANERARLQTVETARYGWDSSPISLPRLAAEL
jgi:thiamine pyrophosphate-dependent acetolactate synthase large subunit-like protein